MTQQAALLTMHPPAACHYCGSTRVTVERDRDLLDRRFARESAVCCDPGSESHCPLCDSQNLEFGVYDYGRDSETGYSDSGERFRCHACGADGDASDCAPPVRPWTEIDAVAAQEPEVVRLPVAGAVALPEVA